MTDYISQLEREELKKIAEQSLENDIKNNVKDVQKEFGFDIFGFGNIIRQRNPKLWKSIEDDWDDIFMNMDFNVEFDVNIRSSGRYLKLIKVVD